MERFNKSIYKEYHLCKRRFKTIFFIQNGEIISIPVSDEVREKLENKVSLWIDESLI